MRRTRTILLIIGLLLWLALAQLRAQPSAAGARTVRRSGTGPLPGYSPTALVRSFESPYPGERTFWTIQEQGQIVAICFVLR